MILYLIIAFVVGVFCGMRWQRNVGSAPRPPARPAEQDVTDAEVEDLLNRGLKLEAIRRYREIHRCDIATAQARVDLLEAVIRR